MVNEKLHSLIDNYFRKFVQKDKNIYNAYLLVYSKKHNIDLNIAEGSTGGITAKPDQPYFIASVSKLYISVLIAKLAEDGKLSFHDDITSYLEPELLHKLHVYKGNDYTHHIKIKHLLNHSSGLHDYFEDKPLQGKSMINMLMDEPNRMWAPEEVIRWSKENLSSHFPPGEGFHYSDTGYHLLGLIIEKVTELPLHQALYHHIFLPSQMKCSYLHVSTPIEQENNPVADLFIRTTNVKNYTSLSVNYAGGGIISTTQDSLTFMQALVNEQLIRRDTFEEMKDWKKFFIGIDYGYGIMHFKYFPLLMPKRYTMWGNAGSTGSFMFYHPDLETYFIGSLNQFRYHRKGIKLMFKLVDIIEKNSDK
ncbi:serine hydrolase domain-containing protein [Bacillus salitolerans]|uniref:Serine hydrolase domain-containing protein n=1 Tax=Bacillus salitolerans TaxID=1437434 RepID=A0ABW4LVD7_9BACI